MNLRNETSVSPDRPPLQIHDPRPAQKGVCAITQPRARNLATVFAFTMLFGVAPAQGADQAPVKQVKPANTRPVSDDAGKSAAQKAMEDLRKRREENQLIEPTQRLRDRRPTTAPLPSLHTGLAPAVIGIAPGGKRPTLRREGEFVIGRRGRLLRPPNSSHMIFQFDADGQQSPDSPMVMLPCRLLEHLERLVQQNADRVVFNITGQVFVYRGLNYLLPTMFTLAVDKGNLQR